MTTETYQQKLNDIFGEICCAVKGSPEHLALKAEHDALQAEFDEFLEAEQGYLAITVALEKEGIRANENGKYDWADVARMDALVNG